MSITVYNYFFIVSKKIHFENSKSSFFFSTIRTVSNNIDPARSIDFPESCYCLNFCGNSDILTGVIVHFLLNSANITLAKKGKVTHCNLTFIANQSTIEAMSTRNRLTLSFQT